jgi:heterotetrameric sarcosine oxidase gamma subunit
MMSDYSPIFRSPITSVSAPSVASSQLSISDLTGVPVILIQGEVGGLLKQHFAQIPAKPGDLVEVSGGVLARLTPTELYLFGLSPNALIPSVAAIEDSLAKGPHFAHATDYTHGKAVIRLAGPAAVELLSKICGLDFHPTVFPNLHVAQTSAAKIKTLIARYDQGETPTYFLHVNRPSGQYFWEVVWEGGQEFELMVADG